MEVPPQQIGGNGKHKDSIRKPKSTSKFALSVSYDSSRGADKDQEMIQPKERSQITK